MGVPTVGHRLVLVVLKCNVLQQAVGDILDDMPLNRETTVPLVLLPVFHALVEVNRSDHLSKTDELPTSIDLQFEQSFS